MFKSAGLAAAALVASSVAGNAAVGMFWDAPADSFHTLNMAMDYADGKEATGTFKATKFDYGQADKGWRIGSFADFLAHDAGSITGVDDGDMQESVFKIEGKTTLTQGQEIVVSSDDGFRLWIDGDYFSGFNKLRGPRGTTTKTFNGDTGTYDFKLWYFEGKRTQAKLVSNLDIAHVPLPAGALLLLTGVGGLAVYRRRRSA